MRRGMVGGRETKGREEIEGSWIQGKEIGGKGMMRRGEKRGNLVRCGAERMAYVAYAMRALAACTYGRKRRRQRRRGHELVDALGGTVHRGRGKRRKREIRTERTEVA